MKILEINKFNYVSGGADRHFLDIVDLFKSTGHQTAVFSMRNKLNEPSDWEKYFVSYVGFQKKDSFWQKIRGLGRMFYSFEAKRKIKKMLEEFRPDIVHIHNIYHHISPSIFGEIRKKKIPIIMTVHDYEFISPDREGYYQSVGKKYWKFIFIKKYSLARRIILVAKKYFHSLFNFQDCIDIFISPSRFTKDLLIKAGIPSEKIAVLPHFIVSKKKNISNINEIKVREKYALYFGRIYAEKGVNDLIKIFVDIPNMKLYLAGSIEDNFSMIENSQTNYLGKLSKEKLREYIAGAKCAVSASVLQETFGLTALESIQLGTPFIGLNSGAYSEVIDQKTQGIICGNLEEMKKVLKKIANDEIKFNRELIAREVGEKYNMEKYYSNIINIFKLKKL